MSKNTMIVANDLGFGDLKTKIDGHKVKQPSIVASFDGDPFPKIDVADPEAVKEGVASLLDNLDVEIDATRYLVGNAASRFNSDSSKKSINSKTGKSKAEDPLTKFITLAFIAGKAVQNASEIGEDIFEGIKVNVKMTTALPIQDIGSDGLTAGEALAYINKFTSHKHAVIVHGFTDPITVTITFEKVVVLREGEIAVLGGIKNGPKEVQDSIKTSIIANYKNLADRADDLVKNAKNIVAIDIGAGTTDISVISNGRTDAELSESLDTGWNDVIKPALRAARRTDRAFGIKDKIRFSLLLNQDVTNERDEHRKELAEEKTRFYVGPKLEDQIMDEFTDLVSDMTDVDIIYIFGGGSITARKYGTLSNKISNVINDMQLGTPVIWIDPKYAQDLNMIGLASFADTIFKTSKK